MAIKHLVEAADGTSKKLERVAQEASKAVTEAAADLAKATTKITIAKEKLEQVKAAVEEEESEATRRGN